MNIQYSIWRCAGQQAITISKQCSKWRTLHIFNGFSTTKCSNFISSLARSPSVSQNVSNVVTGDPTYINARPSLSIWIVCILWIYSISCMGMNHGYYSPNLSLWSRSVASTVHPNHRFRMPTARHSTFIELEGENEWRWQQKANANLYIFIYCCERSRDQIQQHRYR